MAIVRLIRPPISAVRPQHDPPEHIRAEPPLSYRDLEVALFGSEGEMPLAPFFTGANLTLIKPYFTGPFDTDGLLWGMHWDSYRIDSVAQAAGRRR